MKLEERIMDYLVFRANQKDRFQTYAISFLMIAVITLLDNYTGIKVSLFTLYLVPILYVVSKNEILFGYVLTFSCAAVSEFANYLPGEEVYGTIVVWNIFRRTAMLMVIVFFVSMTIKLMRRYHNIVEDQEQLVCRYRPGGRLSFCNNKYAELYGLDHHKISKYNVFDYVPIKEIDTVKRLLLKVSVENPSFTVHYKTILPSDKIQWQRWTHRAIFNFNNSVSEVQAVGRDISEQIKYQELKEQFDKIMLHDIKGPLTGIIGLSESLLKDDSMLEKHKSYIDSIKDAGYRILNRVGVTLNLYKMENGFCEIDKEEIDLLKIVNTSVKDYLPYTESKNMGVATYFGTMKACCSLEYKIMGDKTLTSTMIENLLKNAIEASPPDENIDIRFSNEGKRLSICNKGEVPVEIREKFFDKFVTSKKLRGTGLGTYSAALIARIQGWTIQLDTSVLGQTTISIEFETTR